MAKKTKRYTWFVEPLDSYTNGVISTGLNEGEDLQREIICQNGKRNLWQCPFEVVRFLWNSRTHLGIKLRVYVQEGKGTIRDCTSPLFKKDLNPRKTQKGR